MLVLISETIGRYLVYLTFKWNAYKKIFQNLKNGWKG